ncbi:bifunctional riboflavin kinase/FAD synthetase [Enhydrobacter sp.]|jgi:riboflavin kinase/FMN adenylyltransferase|uniref:bifunctional riboflavin kinase/FAD synthetase n=1 Tax=Enhydrobacter sp. TaxID=1894999 RepID=UPI00261F5683|nr:bifunctional riboflavin kinase/FAD synthetase [Enhydrobacter sp.]WIM11632.1 MAG: FMN adenylyltransferase / Riboflavin kinase [Enhydrobacter sp.]
MIPVFEEWQGIPAPWKGGAVALGNFDGVHRGHQALIALTVEQAQALDAPVLALTFEPHPRRFFVPDTGPFRLTLPPAKVRLLEEQGVQAVLAQRFDQAFAGLSADAFVDEVLLKGLVARHVVCGYDFTFGARRGGNVEKLRKLGRERGFGVTILDPVMREGEIYSSTSIREALRAGWPSEAAELLGRPWEIEGVVEQGDKRGRTIGFPTANVALGEHLRPRFGVYAVRALVDGTWRDGVANVGRRPTVGKLQENFEVHLFDFSGDLYGKTLRVALIDFIRPEMKFAGLDQLKAQIAADAQAARSILAG